MNPQPLPKAIYDKAKELGVFSIRLEFSGGNDEGHLYVSTDSFKGMSPDINSLEREIEKWAWEAYSYSGAGDGNDYGDNIEYDLENNKVKTSEWYMVRKESETEESAMRVEGEFSEIDRNSSKNSLFIL